MDCGSNGWPKWAIMLLLALGLGGCDEKKKGQETVLAEEERKLLEPIEDARSSLHRCRAEEQAQKVTIRARSSKDSPGSVEIGGAARVEGGFAVGILRNEGESSVELGYLDGRGLLRISKPGRVHGSVDAPQVVGVGDDVLVVVSDNDAGHSRLRLAKVSAPAATAQVVWGPEVTVRRGESQAVSLTASAKPSEKEPARVLLAWDDFDKPTLRSEIRGLIVDPKSMQPVLGERTLSPAFDDAVEPTVLGGLDEAPFVLVWLSYQEAGPRNGTDHELVEEPPKMLKVARLDENLSLQGEPIALSAKGSNVLAYDAALLPSGRLIVAYRQATRGRTEGASPVEIRTVGADGAVIERSVSHAELGLGAPAVFSMEESDRLWLSARGGDSDVLLGDLGGDGEVVGFELERGLAGKIPLLGSANRLLVMEPDGLDFRLSALVCAR